MKNWSEQQKAIFEAFKSGKNNIVVRARAGTGKTTTILEAISYAPEASILLAAFNKKIAEELKTKLTNSKAEAKTLHSVGFSLVTKNWRGVKLDTKRGAKLAQHAADQSARSVAANSNAPAGIVNLVERLAAKGKSVLPFPTESKMIELAYHFDLSPDEAQEEAGWTVNLVAQAAIQAMSLALKNDGTLDFDDMVYVPVANRWVRGMYDLVVIDEAQDMNASQLLLAQGVVKKGGRVVVVGDDRQAIYAFRGAEAGSLDRLKTELKAVELGLTTTYRCPQLIVAEASNLVPDYKAAPTAPMGVIETLDFDKLHEQAVVGNFVLSRKNAPLARVCLKLLRNGTRARIEGKDMGAQLVKIVKDLKAKSIPDFMVRLNKWETRQSDRTRKAASQNMEAKLDALKDQAETLKTLADGMTGMLELIARIESLFSETPKGKADYVVCSSVHRAKGLETDTVFVLGETLYPGGKHTTEEQNIHYVAVTRAKNKLVWVEGLEKNKEV